MLTVELTRDDEKWRATSDRAIKNLIKQNPKGEARYRRTLKDLDSDPWRHRFSTPELILFLELIRADLPVKHHAVGPHRYELDMAIFILGAGGGIDIECDGAPWHYTPSAVARDKKRDKRLAQLGFLTIRIKAEDIENRVMDVARLVKRVYKAVDDDPKVLFRPKSLERFANMIMKRDRNLNLQGD